MPIYERLQAMGTWGLNLKAGTPKFVRDQITMPFQHIVITPSWVDVTGMTDAAVLAAARYTGVILRPGPQLELGGAGVMWWLGDDQGRPILESSIQPAGFGTTGQGLAAWMADLRPVLDWTGGSIAGAGPVGGNYDGFFWRVSRRQAMDTIARYFQVEWRVYPNFVHDYGTAADLYGSTPTVVAVPRGQGGRELGLSGFTVEDLRVDTDYSDYLSKVVVIGRDGNGSAGVGGATSFWSPSGLVVTRSALVNAPDVFGGSEANYGQSVLNSYADVNLVTVSTRDYDVRSMVGPGNYMWVYEPDANYYDAANQIQYQGMTIFPKKVRVVGMRWGISQGMGVYHRHKTSSPGVTYTDLTPYVEWDQPGTEFEIGPAAFTPIGGDVTSAVSTQEPAITSMGWRPYTPTITGTGTAIGNGTVNGYYRREGSTLHLRITWTLGSTSTVGSGGVVFSLPTGATAATTTNGYQTLHAMFNDTGTATNAGVGYIASAGTTITCAAILTNSTYGSWSGLAANIPFTWASTDYINVNGTIEVAP